MDKLEADEASELRRARDAKHAGMKSYFGGRVAQRLMKRKLLKGMDKDDRGRRASFHADYAITGRGEAALRDYEKPAGDVRAGLRETSRSGGASSASKVRIKYKREARAKRKSIVVGKRVV